MTVDLAVSQLKYLRCRLRTSAILAVGEKKELRSRDLAALDLVLTMFEREFC